MQDPRPLSYGKTGLTKNINNYKMFSTILKGCVQNTVTK